MRVPARAPLVAVAVVAASFLLASGGDGAPTRPAGTALAGEDASSGAARSRALAAAVADPGVRTELGERRWRAVHVERTPEAKDARALPRGCRASRCRVVSIYVYTDDSLLLAYVRDHDAKVVATTVATGQPPLSEEEQREAHAIAERDRVVLDRLDGTEHAHRIPAYPMYPSTGPCARHRCASVVYIRPGTGEPLGAVLVDLSAVRVVRRALASCEGDCG